MSMSKSTQEPGDAPIVTDPYSVPVGKTASNNPPFIAKRSKELPAGRKGFRSHNTQILNEKKKGENSQVDTTQYRPEPPQNHCHENRIIERSRIRNTAGKPYAQAASALRTGLLRLTIPADS